MKTVFISSLKPLHFVLNPDSKDLDYYFSLTKAPEFLESHESLLLELPQLIGVDFSSFEGKNIFDHPIFDDPQLIITWQYLPNCNLHQKMVSTFEDVAFLALFFGLCYLNYRDFNVSEPHIHFASSRKEIVNISANYPSDQLTALFIPLQLSKNKLKEWIDNNWHSIESDIQKLPQNVADYIPKNLKIGIEISNLRGEQKTFEEISRILYKKYSDDDRLADYGHIKNIYHRYLQYMPKGVVGALALNSLKRSTK